MFLGKLYHCGIVVSTGWHLMVPGRYSQASTAVCLDTFNAFGWYRLLSKKGHALPEGMEMMLCWQWPNSGEGTGGAEQLRFYSKHKVTRIRRKIFIHSS